MPPARPRRLGEIPGVGIDRAAASGNDPEVLRLENLDTDLPPPSGVVEAARAAMGVDEFNSYVSFTGRAGLKEAVAAHPHRRSGIEDDAGTQVVISCGDGDGMVDALLATIDVGEEAILTDPVYAGILNRVRLVGGVPMRVEADSWRLDLEGLAGAVTFRTRAVDGRVRRALNS